MDTLNHYWTFLILQDANQIHLKEHPVAQPYFTAHIQPLLPPLATDTHRTIPHRTIQRTLYFKAEGAGGSGGAGLRPERSAEREQGSRGAIQNPKSSIESEICLRCFISHSIDFACQQLATQFGPTHGFTKMDLLPFVLPDDRLLQNPDFDKLSHRAKVPSEAMPDRAINPKSAYRSLPTHIIETFDPKASNLKTWTVRLVRQAKELNRLLLDYGVYLLSDWAILNNTKETQLKHILSAFCNLSQIETEQAVLLLEGYHRVYRGDRLQQKLKGQCAPPSTDQLQRICTHFNHHLDTENITHISPLPDSNSVLQELQTLARYLRDYRIYTQSKILPTQSLDNPESGVFIDQVTAPDSDQHSDDDDIQILRRTYQELFGACLDNAITTVITQRVTQLGKRKGDRDKLFIKGLYLYCQGQTMTDIAPQLGYERQDKVTFLLKLKDLRADIRHEMLRLLGDRIQELALRFQDPEKLHALDQQIDAVLDEQVTALMEKAKQEATGVRNGPLKSLFYQRLMIYLDGRPDSPWSPDSGWVP